MTSNTLWNMEHALSENKRATVGRNNRKRKYDEKEYEIHLEEEIKKKRKSSIS